MADLVMGTMSSLIPKLGQLLEEEYHLQTDVKERISSLKLELELAQAALSMVAEVPWDQLDKPVQIWARLVREASYDMEDVLDAFLVRVKGPDSTEDKQSLLKYVKKMTKFIKKSKDRRRISGDVKDIITHLQEVTKRCRRYKVDDIVARRATTSAIDPRLRAMYTQVNKLVGMDKSSGELMSMLRVILQRGDLSSTKMKIVSIVGVGGLGKTTLAKVVYDKIKWNFDCAAFVPVGRNPDLKKILKDILIDLRNEKNLHSATLDERQLIDRLRDFLVEKRNQRKKRFLIVIDDIWETESWEIIKLAIDDEKNCGGRIIITTRNMEVATKANEVYKLQPLSYDSSVELLYARIYGHEARHVDRQPDEISDKFVRKCGGIPLAIITMASLLAGKPRDKWSGLYSTIDFGSKDNKEAENTMRILSFSYYDLPSHLRTCLLYLSAFPEDSVIDKGSLVWKWVAEGFVKENSGISLFEIGERYFNDLINRSMIQAVESNNDDSIIIIGCRVHDVVLDFIRSMSREELFFTVVDNDEYTLLQSNLGQQSNARRLANHNRNIGHTHATNHTMPKLRSFIALECVIETWAAISSFTLLRVLAVENCKPRAGGDVRVEHIGHLVHLRFLSLSGTRIDRIPEEIGALRFLQTLDLSGSRIPELPSSCSSLKRLACLRMTLTGDDLDGKLFSAEGMTSLEELSMIAWTHEPRRRLVKGLGCLRELRVLRAPIVFDEETERDLMESLRHLDKLQSLTIDHTGFSTYESSWQGTELILSCHLRHLSFSEIEFCKLPSCINPGCLPNLSHLDLRLEDADEQDLKTLGGLPELRFLGLKLFRSSSATISNISDACYFPKLRCFRVRGLMVLFVVASKGDKKSVSFHIWNGRDDMGVMPFVSDDDDNELERPVVSASDDELKSDEDEMQGPIMPTVSDDDEFHGPLQRRSILQRGIAAIAYYLLAFLRLVLAFVKIQPHQKLGHHTSISGRGSAPALNGEDPIDMPSVSDGDDQRNDSIYSKGSAAPCFMPSLQVLHFEVGGRAMEDTRYCDNLGWEYLPSLQKINVRLPFSGEVEAALRRAANVHPNCPTLRLEL